MGLSVSSKSTLSTRHSHGCGLVNERGVRVDRTGIEGENSGGADIWTIPLAKFVYIGTLWTLFWLVQIS
jgi:hypothetical protein